MPDDFDTVVADRCRAVDDVPVPADIWSRVQFKVLDRAPVQVTDEEATLIDLGTPSQSDDHTPSRRALLAGLLGAAAAVVAIAIVATRDDASPDTTSTAVEPSSVESSFAAAIESADVLIQPSAEEVASSSDFLPTSGSTQVSAAGNFATLLGRECSIEPPCDSRRAYETGSVDGGEVHRGVLGLVDEPELFVLDDRFFVVVESGAQAAPTAWLIDAVSGGHAELTWRDEPTTVSSPGQALIVTDGNMSVSRSVRQQKSEDPIAGLSLPRVVDARDGTIRPLSVPDDASADLPVAQHGDGRVWVATAPEGRSLDDEVPAGAQAANLAYSDDGGATWAAVTLPVELSSGVSIAADGDHIAVTTAWSYADVRYVYVSSDAGLSWSTVTVANPSTINGAFLYVLADKRLVLVRSDDMYAAELFVSAGSDWNRLQRDLKGTQATKRKYVSVNPDGIGMMYFPDEVFDDGTIGNSPDAPPIRHQFSNDLTTWWTIAQPTGDDTPPHTTDEPLTAPVPNLFANWSLGAVLAPGTYAVDFPRDDAPPHIFVTLDDGWLQYSTEYSIRKRDLAEVSASKKRFLGVLTFTIQPDLILLDACHSSEGFFGGPLSTLDNYVTALTEQDGWAQVTAPTDITIDGYPGKAFQRTAPADFSDCNPDIVSVHGAVGADRRVVAPFKSWAFGGTPIDDVTSWSIYEPGEIETLQILDLNGTIVIVHTNLEPPHQASENPELAAVLDTIRIAT